MWHRPFPFNRLARRTAPLSKNFRGTRPGSMMRLLAVPGLHFLVTRFGPAWLRNFAFDAKYQSGHWSFHLDDRSELHEVVRAYLRRGDLFVVGCGTGSVLNGLEESGLDSVLGIDVSKEAITRAVQHASARVTFQVADVETFQCPRLYDEILFSESLYYIRPSRQLTLLHRLSRSLKPGGVFVVTLADVARYHDVVRRVRLSFCVLEDRALRDSTRHLLVFRPHHE